MQELTPEENAQGFHQDGVWHGRPKLHCNFCAYDSIQESHVVRHLEVSHHFVAAARRTEVEVHRRLSVPLYDGSGKLIQTVSEKQLI